jgi:hypothetical protein
MLCRDLVLMRPHQSGIGVIAQIINPLGNRAARSYMPS